MHPFLFNFTRALTTVMIAASAAAVLAGCGDDAPPVAAHTPKELTDAVAAQLTGEGLAGVVPRNAIDATGTYLIDFNLNATQSDVREIAQIDTKDIIQAIKRSTVVVNNLVVHVWYPVADDYGHTTAQPVIAMSFSAATLGKIDADGLRSDNVIKVADAGIVHPGF